MNQIKDIISLGLMERDKKKVGVRWPYKKLILSTSSKENKRLIEEFESLLKSQLNVKDIIVKKDKHPRILVDFKDLLEAEGHTRELIRLTQAFRKKLGLIKNQNIELHIFVQAMNLKEDLDKNMDFIKKRTNAKKTKIYAPGEGNLERFDHKTDFKIRFHNGSIAINIKK